MNTKDDTVKLVFSPKLAKYLLSKNFIIVDLKPNRNNPDKTVFVFRNDPGLIAEMVMFNK